MVRTYDPDGYRINSRTADQIAAGQVTQHQQALAENQATGTVVERQAAPISLTPEQKAAQNNAQLVSPQPQTGEFIEQNRNARLAANNATPEQIAQNQQNLKGIMNPGFGETSGLGLVDTTKLSPLSSAGVGESVADFEARRASIEQQNTQKLQQDKLKSDSKREKAGREASASAAAAAADPQTAGMSALFSNLPPEAQSMAPFFENILSTISQGQEDSAKATNALLNGGTIDVNGQPVQVQGINSVYDQMDKKIADMEKGYTAMQQGIQGMLDKAKEQQDKYISEQEKAQKDRLAWQETSMLRQAASEKQKAVDSRIARLALTGGFGSDGGLREIEETRAEYENRMDDIKTEFGIQHTELAAKFTGLYLEASNEHLTKSIGNIKDTASALERIAGQSMSTKQARNHAEQSVLGKFLDTQSASRKELANTYLGIAKEIQTTINQERANKKTEADQAWDQFKWLKTTYGTNIPPTALEGIRSKLPGVDVDSLAQALTADEIEKARKARGGGGGGGSLSFLPSQMNALGQPPSLDDFLKQKERESFERGEIKFDRKAAEAEYKAKVSAVKQYDPNEIVTRFKNKAGPMAKHERSYAESVLNDYLASGNFKAASEFVDNTGGEIASTESKDFTQALNARYDINKLSGKIEEIGLIGPISGRLRELNPYDSRVVEFQNLITQTVPNLARGVFREVGVLTDSDVERYTSTIGNPELTLEQARTAFQNLKQKIDVSMANQISVWDANGKRVKGFRDLYDSQPVSQQQGQVSTGSDPAISAYVQSLNRR